MYKKIIASSLLVMAMIGFSQGTLAKGKKSSCDGKVVNVSGTNSSDTIVINDDNTYTVNDGDPVSFTSPAIVAGGNGNDTITGSADDDVICGGNGNDIIKGGDGSDRIFGQNGKDTLDGDNDVLCVAGTEITCDDYVAGGNGKDTIAGGNGNDTLDGNNGVDTIDAGLGVDLIDGGNGKDSCSYDSTETDDVSGCESTPQ
jgi:Ca2+-binding RTX toxin-like protein